MSKKTIITSILLIILCLSLISGSTYAIFTSESQINIAVTSGKVDVKANLSIDSIYSATPDVNGNLIDENNFTYSHVQQTNTDITGKLLFSNYGRAFLDTRGVLNLDRITPGDKVVVKLSVTNESNISAKYRLKVEVPKSNKELASILVTTIDNEEFVGLSSYRGKWNEIGIGQNPVYYFTIEMPMNAGSTYQNLSSSMVITIEAVQGNAATDDELIINTFTTQSSTNSAYLSNNGSATILAKVSPSNDDKNTVVKLNKVGMDGNKATLNIKTSNIESTYENVFNISGNNIENVVGTIDLNLLVNNIQTSVFSQGSAIISTYIVKGLSTVNIIYGGTDSSVTFGYSNPGSRIYTGENDVITPGQYYYNPTTGLLVFATDHFSEYLISTNGDMKIYVPYIDIMYPTLYNALTYVDSGSTIILLDDIVLETEFTLIKDVTIKGKSITFDKSVNTSLIDKPIWIASPSGKINVFKDITIKGIKGDYTFGVEYCNVEMTNVIIDSNYNTAFYQQIGTATLNNVTITNSGLNGDVVSNKDTAIAVAYGGTVIVNEGTYTSENGYAVYIYESGGTVIINNGTFEGTICANLDRTNNYNRESHIIIYDGIFTDPDFTTIVQNESMRDYISIEIKGGKFNIDPSSYVDLNNYTVTNLGGIWEVSEKTSN